LYNGYIPAYQINKPDGIMGVPANYTPVYAPLNQYPANYDPNNCNDPNCGLYGTNLVNLTLKDGTQIQDTKGDYKCPEFSPTFSDRLLPLWRWNSDVVRRDQRSKVIGDFLSASLSRWL
jgi:hypothetical protein